MAKRLLSLETFISVQQQQRFNMNYYLYLLLSVQRERIFDEILKIPTTSSVALPQDPNRSAWQISPVTSSWVLLLSYPKCLQSIVPPLNFRENPCNWPPKSPVGVLEEDIF